MNLKEILLGTSNQENIQKLESKLILFLESYQKECLKEERREKIDFLSQVTSSLAFPEILVYYYFLKQDLKYPDIFSKSMEFGIKSPSQLEDLLKEKFAQFMKVDFRKREKINPQGIVVIINKYENTKYCEEIINLISLDPSIFDNLHSDEIILSLKKAVRYKKKIEKDFYKFQDELLYVLHKKMHDLKIDKRREEYIGNLQKMVFLISEQTGKKPKRIINLYSEFCNQAKNIVDEYKITKETKLNSQNKEEIGKKWSEIIKKYEDLKRNFQDKSSRTYRNLFTVPLIEQNIKDDIIDYFMKINSGNF